MLEEERVSLIIKEFKKGEWKYERSNFYGN
jgi:hypothetical protein